MEILLSHSTGISDSYFRPTETELLEEFLKATDFLTIAEENRLRKKIDDLSEESKNNDYIMQGKWLEKDKKIEVLSKKYEEIDATLQAILRALEQILVFKKEIKYQNS